MTNAAQLFVIRLSFLDKIPDLRAMTYIAFRFVCYGLSFIHPCTIAHSTTIHSSIYPSIHVILLPFVQTSCHPSNQPSINLTIHRTLSPSIHPPVHPSNQPTI